MNSAGWQVYVVTRGAVIKVRTQRSDDAVPLCDLPYCYFGKFFPPYTSESWVFDYTLVFPRLSSSQKLFFGPTQLLARPPTRGLYSSATLQGPFTPYCDDPHSRNDVFDLAECLSCVAIAMLLQCAWSGDQTTLISWPIAPTHALNMLGHCLDIIRPTL